MKFWGDFYETFLKGSVDHVIYRDYTVNRRSFIYYSLACRPVFVEAALPKRNLRGVGSRRR